MSDFILKAGLDLPIAGGATDGVVTALEAPSTVAVTPPDFPGVTVRLAVKEGDTVQAGQPLGHSKLCPEMKFVSPAAGRVSEIRRGHRRSIQAIVVECSGNDVVNHGAISAADIAKLGAEKVRERLLAGGAWPLLRAKPMAQVANPEQSPVAILVSAMETGPNCADPEVLLEGREADLEAGFAAITQLAPTVHLTHGTGGRPKALAGVQGVETHSFSGPHPAGDPEVQINFVCSPGAEQIVWFCRAVDVADMGALLLSGELPRTTRVVVAGGVNKPNYVAVQTGAPVADLLAAAGGADADAHRIVGGSVLTGRALEANGYLAQGVHTMSVVPEGGKREFMGWLDPGANKFSNHRMYLSKLFGGKRFRLTTDTHGGPRALIPIGSYKKVVPSDIEPDYLMKAILCEDIEEMLGLGLLEMSREEAALCTVVCPSKINYSQILERGWRQYQKETA